MYDFFLLFFLRSFFRRIPVAFEAIRGRSAVLLEPSNEIGPDREQAEIVEKNMAVDGSRKDVFFLITLKIGSIPSPFFSFLTRASKRQTNSP